MNPKIILAAVAAVASVVGAAAAAYNYGHLKGAQKALQEKQPAEVV